MPNPCSSLLPALALAACASASGPALEPTPPGCDVGHPCGDGAACRLDTRQCVAAPISIDDRDFFPHDARLLATSSGPELTGLVLDPTTTELSVLVDDQEIARADLASGRWGVRLPEGTLSPDGARVVLRAVSSAGSFEIARTFALDTSQPSARVESGTRDEWQDRIDFGSGAPVHTHAGPYVEARPGCTDIYKYAYLMDPEPPAFAAETSRNPLAWVFLPSGVGFERGTARYRIRAGAGAQATVLRDWTDFEPPIDQAYVLPLFRSGPRGIPSLGTTAQQLHVDAVFRDWKGLETTTTVCWNHHPLAAPVEVQRPTPATAGDPLLAMSLAADAPVSRILRHGEGAPVIEARLRHFAAEPVHVRLRARAPGAAYVEHVVHDLIASVIEPSGIDCTVEPCHEDAPADPEDVVIAGETGGAAWTGRLLDAATLQPVPCGPAGCLLPPRTDGPPREYLYVVSLEGADELAPDVGAGGAGGEVGEHALLGLTFTGLDPATSGTVAQCLERRLVAGRETCVRQRTFRRLVAIDRLQLQIPPIAIELVTSVGAAQLGVAPAYLPGGAVSSDALTWDSGDDDLPGVH